MKACSKHMAKYKNRIITTEGIWATLPADLNVLLFVLAHQVLFYAVVRCMFNRDI